MIQEEENKSKKIKRICKWCNKEFEVIPSILKRDRGKFCSRNCYAKWRSKNLLGKNNPHWKGGKIKRKCLICNKEFEVKKCDIKKECGKYCSYSCSRKSRKIPNHHTKLELIFEEICKKYNFSFQYVGNSKLWIGKNPSINPDFIEANGKKIAIFINGDYWHSPLLRYNIRDSQRIDTQIRICKKHKWTPVVIWGSDLLREDAEQFVLSKLR